MVVLIRLQDGILMINLTGKKRVCKDTGRIFECSENGKASGIHMEERKTFKPYRNSISKHIEFL